KSTWTVVTLSDLGNKRIAHPCRQYGLRNRSRIDSHAEILRVRECCHAQNPSESFPIKLRGQRTDPGHLASVIRPRKSPGSPAITAVSSREKRSRRRYLLHP